MSREEQLERLSKGIRLIYCECGEFISIEVQQMQAKPPFKCLNCEFKFVIELLERT